MLVRESGGQRRGMHWRLGHTHGSKAVNTIGSFFLMLLRIRFTIPEASCGIEAMRKDDLLRGSSYGTIGHTEPVSATNPFKKLFHKRSGIGTSWHVELNPLQQLLSLLVMLGRNQRLDLGQEGFSFLRKRRFG